MIHVADELVITYLITMATGMPDLFLQGYYKQFTVMYWELHACMFITLASFMETFIKNCIEICIVLDFNVFIDEGV